MSYVELVATITAVAAVGNLTLQSVWFKWSYSIQKRKHFTDKAD